MSVSRSKTFRQDGFTYVNPRDGYIYKIIGDHAHVEVIQLIRAGEIPVAYLQVPIPKGNHDSRELIVNAFEDEEAKCHT
jgi:hypothetical protein